MSTKHEKILISAFRRWPEEAFSAEDLVVACWREFPEDFGLQGYEKLHPDSNVVYRYIMGQESIVKKHKWLLQTRSKTYRLSTQGVSHALTLGTWLTLSYESQRVRIERAREAVLSRLLRSRAWKKHEIGDKIVFREACAFWGVIPRSANEEFRFARKELEDSLAAAEERIGESDWAGLFVPEANRSVDRGTLATLRQLDAKLTKTFADEISGITGRVIDRGRVKQV